MSLIDPHGQSTFEKPLLVGDALARAALERWLRR
jgi:hypothetical protein